MPPNAKKTTGATRSFAAPGSSFGQGPFGTTNLRLPPAAAQRQAQFQLQPPSQSRPATPGGVRAPMPVRPLDFSSLIGPTAAFEAQGLLQPPGAFPVRTSSGAGFSTTGLASEGSDFFRPDITTPTRTATGAAGAGGGTGQQGAQGRQQGPGTSASLIARLSMLVDPAVLNAILQNATANGFAILGIDTDEQGNVVIQTDHPDEPFIVVKGNIAAGNNPFEAQKLKLDQEKFTFEQDFNNRTLASRERIADNEIGISRDRITADREIAQGNWDNALAIQDRIDGRERENRELERELARLNREHDQQRVNIERSRFELEKLQFLSTLQAMNPIDFMNLSRGQPLTAAGGPLPGGLQRVGPQNPLAGMVSPSTMSGEALGAAQPAQAPSQAGQPLPSAIDALQAGQNPQQPLQLPEGTARVPSTQQLNRFTPAERQYLASLVQAQGLNLEDFGRFVEERSPSSQRRTSRVV